MSDSQHTSLVELEAFAENAAGAKTNILVQANGQMQVAYTLSADNARHLASAVETARGKTAESTRKAYAIKLQHIVEVFAGNSDFEHLIIRSESHPPRIDYGRWFCSSTSRDTAHVPMNNFLSSRRKSRLTPQEQDYLHKHPNHHFTPCSASALAASVGGIFFSAHHVCEVV